MDIQEPPTEAPERFGVPSRELRDGHLAAQRAAAKLAQDRRLHMRLICAHTREVIALDAQIVALEPQLTEHQRAAIKAETDEQDESMLNLLTASAGQRGEELSRG